MTICDIISFVTSEILPVSNKEIQNFRETILSYYSENRRMFPWRETWDPYKIFISEIMLQQTQTDRIIEKFNAFVMRFPNFKTLAEASLQEIFKYWQGLGYNRRALYLKQSAELVQKKYMGRLPDSSILIDELPGIGKATACAIVTYSFNTPTVFIETNVRSVFLHYFFPEQDEVSDDLLYPLVERSLDHEDPRNWYYALMDYGVMVKKTLGNPNKRSKHYTKQLPFLQSNRRVRGLIMKALNDKSSLTAKQIINSTEIEPEKVEYNLKKLTAEMMIREKDGKYSIP
jgi:A/G-specific adenine glycosylase